MKYIFIIILAILSCSTLKLNHNQVCNVKYQWGGVSSPWQQGGNWTIGTDKQLNMIRIASANNGSTLIGNIQYVGGERAGFLAITKAPLQYLVWNQFGGPLSQWYQIGKWYLGDRVGQKIVQLNVTRQSNGELKGTCQYLGEGVIGFKATCS